MNRILLNTNKEDLKILRTKSEKITKISDEDKKLLTEMYAYVKDPNNHAVGLSAIQVGVPKRLCAIKYQDCSYKLVNPLIVSHSTKKIYETEGCLSVSKEHDDEKKEAIGRWETVVVSGYDLIQNKQVMIRAKGFLARIFQHEIDHMNGILFIDYLK